MGVLGGGSTRVQPETMPPHPPPLPPGLPRVHSGGTAPASNPPPRNPGRGGVKGHTGSPGSSSKPLRLARSMICSLLRPCRQRRRRQGKRRKR